MTPTESQRRAIEHRGSDLLVVASAGSGKTQLLSQRVVELIADPRRPCDVDRLLVVTFTRAAAEELRSRIAGQLRQRIADTPEGPLRTRLTRQEWLLGTAEIGTIDAWCGRLVRENFDRAGVDPDFSMLSEEAAAVLHADALDDLLEWVYASDEADAGAARAWIASTPRPNDAFLADMLRRLHRVRELLLNPEDWLRRQAQACAMKDDEARAAAQRGLAEALRADCAFQAEQLAEVLARIENGRSRDSLADYRARLLHWMQRLASPGALQATIQEIHAYALPRAPKSEPGPAETWRVEVRERWLKKGLQRAWPPEAIDAMIAAAPQACAKVALLLALEQRWDAELLARKSARAAYEFGDVLALGLRLLGEWDSSAGRYRPTELALRLRERYEHILVDECQDTSPVQLELIRLVAREPPLESNRTLVGDVKQSIYGFRQAEPRLLIHHIDQVRTGRAPGRIEPLADNFRSHPDLLDALNALFERLFDPALGGVAYDEAARLRARRCELDNPTLDGRPRLEVHVLVQDPDADPTNGPGAPLKSIEREALCIARRIDELLRSGAQRLERGRGGPCLRPIRHGDVVVLLRAARENAPRLAAMLRVAGVPAAAGGRESILECIEVRDVCNVLALLANRRQDLALAAYLRGPFVGLTEPQLVRIRAAARRSRKRVYFDAVQALLRCEDEPALRAQLAAALAQLDRWRRAACELDLPSLVRLILRDTDLRHFAAALPDAAYRLAMIDGFERLVAASAAQGIRDPGALIEHFESLESQQADPSAAPADDADVVRVMTVHQAKGLEFPVAILANAGAEFHPADREGLAFHERHGIGIDHFDYPRRQRVTSAVTPIVRRLDVERALDEELRLLYVAATRAQELFLVCGSMSPRRLRSLENRMRSGGPVPLITRKRARSTLEWVLAALYSGDLDAGRGVNQAPFAALRVHEPSSDEQDLVAPQPRVTRSASVADVEWTAADDRWLSSARALLEQPPDRTLAARPAVVSISAMKELAAAADGGAAPDRSTPAIRWVEPLRGPRFAAAELPDGRAQGAAVHRLLAWIDPRELATAERLRRAASRLVDLGRLTPDELALVALDDLEWFGTTPIARLLAAQPERIHRELPFVARLPGPPPGEAPITRGVIDCLVELDAGLALYDYKTDRLRDADDAPMRIESYRVQVRLYAAAARRLFDKPVREAALVFLHERRIEPVDVHGGAWPPMDGLGGQG